MKVLVGCEESQAVTIEFRKLGVEAYSCDILPCSGNHPEWHFQEDIFDVIAREKFDMGIFFPPCTHLAVSGAKHFEQKRKDGRQQEGIDFFLKIVNCGISKIAIENPVGIMSTIYRKPDQIVQPYFFGDEAQKTTCLWLINLPKLRHTKLVGKGSFYTSPTGKKMASWICDPIGKNGKKLAYSGEEIKSLRSKTFPGIAEAMATQWSNIQEPMIKTQKQLELFS